MHPRHYTLSERLGTERPFAYVPRSVARDGTLPDGAGVLYATLAALGKEDGGASASPAELAGYIGVTGHSIRKWSTEMTAIDGVTIEPRARGLWEFDLGQDRRALIASRKFARVPLITWNDSATWSMPMRRLWIALWSYCGNGRGCFVGMERLARECGGKERATQGTLRQLETVALVRVIYRRWATSDILPFNGEQFVEPAERNETADLERNETADLDCERNENARRAERKRIASVTKPSIERNENAPYLKIEQESIRKGEHVTASRRRRQVRDEAIAAERTGPLIWKDGTVDVQATIEALEKSA